MASATDRLEHVHPEDRAAWRAWLVANHGTATGAWLVSWKAVTGRPRIPYADTVEEALCVGWVDSRAGTIDEERSRQLFTPRRAGSGWSRPNKERIERLTAAGLLLPAGVAVVEAAQADGSWFALDDVENLVEPPELADALDADPRARGHWDGFPRSAKRAILEWISTAKRPDTKSKRIAQTARLAAENVRANEWRPKG